MYEIRKTGTTQTILPSFKHTLTTNQKKAIIITKFNCCVFSSFPLKSQVNAHDLDVESFNRGQKSICTNCKT